MIQPEVEKLSSGNLSVLVFQLQDEMFLQQMLPGGSTNMCIPLIYMTTLNFTRDLQIEIS